LPCLDCAPRNIRVVEGDLLDQNVDVIVNAWNRNIIPWWLLLPQGVSGAIKKRGGTGPFKELRKHGPIPLGGAVLTSAGRLPFKGIIHVAGINMLWRASERSIRDSVRNALALAASHGVRSIAFPLIGAGSGGFNQERAQAIMLEVDTEHGDPIERRAQKIVQETETLQVFDGGVFFTDERGIVVVTWPNEKSRLLGQDMSGSLNFEFIRNHPGLAVFLNIEPLGPQGEDSACLVKNGSQVAAAGHGL